MLHLKNDTPFAAKMVVLSNLHGQDALYVFVKATYDLTNPMAVAENQLAVFSEDVYWGEPGVSSLKYPADVHPEKPGTDVVVVGDACVPDGRQAVELNVGLSVAGRIKAVKVFGDRTWDGGVIFMRPGKPKPFSRLPIVYERAFGGAQVIDKDSDKILTEARNPVGKGFSGKGEARDPAVIGVPNIEDPRNLMKSMSDKPTPAGFGAIAPFWQPRASFAGTFDAHWKKTRAPFPPEDCDPRFFHAAHPDLIFSPHLQGGEPVIIVNMSPKGKQRFDLPVGEPKVKIDMTGRFYNVKPMLETVLLEPTRESISLTWRASSTNGKKITEATAEITL